MTNFLYFLAGAALAAELRIAWLAVGIFEDRIIKWLEDLHARLEQL